jgi:multiple sugar transport system permease protein
MSETKAVPLQSKAIPAVIGKRTLSLATRRTLEGYLFASPWIIGFFIFTLGPFVASFWISLNRWDILTPMHFNGLDNYIALFQDELFWKSLSVTLIYFVLSVPAQLILAFILAVLLNGNNVVNYFFRGVFFLPYIVSGVATAILWRWMYNPEFGLINFLLSKIGITGPTWLNSTGWVLPSLALMGLWGIGSNMLIYLASLQSVPEHLYEAAEIDGASRFSKLRFITLPMMSSSVFFTLVIGIITSFQVFTQAFVMTQGGPENASLFYVFNLYRQAFVSFKMGYASAMAWMLFLVVLAITLLQFKLAGRWVYYEVET